MPVLRLSDLESFGIFRSPSKPVFAGHQEDQSSSDVKNDTKNPFSSSHTTSEEDIKKQKIEQKSKSTSPNNKNKSMTNTTSTSISSSIKIQQKNDKKSNNPAAHSSATTASTLNTSFPPLPTSNNFKPCELLYMQSLQHTETFTLDNVELLEILEDPQKPQEITCLVFDKSIFHPQGGGQPTDTGTVRLQNVNMNVSTTFILEIVFVRTDKESGRVLHDVKQAKSALNSEYWKPGAKVAMEIDAKARMLNARIHSAGHLLDVAVRNCGLRWVPGKGYHFPDGPYVEYIIEPSDKEIINKDKDGLCKQIEQAAADLIEAKGKISMQYKSGVRHVDFCGVESHCGGSHVDDLGKIGKLLVTKIQPKKDRARVSYKVLAE